MLVLLDIFLDNLDNLLLNDDSLLSFLYLLRESIDLVVKLLVMLVIVRLLQLFLQVLDDLAVFFDLLVELVDGLLHFLDSLLLLFDDALELLDGLLVRLVRRFLLVFIFSILLSDYLYCLLSHNNGLLLVINLLQKLFNLIESSVGMTQKANLLTYSTITKILVRFSIPSI